MVQSIRALGGAVTTLSKHQSFLQTSLDLDGLRVAASKSELDASQQAQLNSFLQQAPSAGSYASQSGAIFGILEQMKETFETNMAQSQKDEAQAVSEFNALKAAKTEEINTASNMVDAQTQQLAQANEDNAAAKQNLKDTQEALAADTKFLADLKQTCANADAEYEERSKTRAEEIQAVAETIGILNSDESHDLMGSTLGFVQKEAARRTRAQLKLRAAAARTG